MTYENINTPDELYRYMSENIKYGFVSSDKKIYSRAELKNDNNIVR